MVRTYQGFVALRNAFEDFPSAGRIFTKPKIDRKTVLDAEYMIVPSREVEGYLVEKGGEIPIRSRAKVTTNGWKRPCFAKSSLTGSSAMPRHQLQICLTQFSTMTNMIPSRMPDLAAGLWNCPATAFSRKSACRTRLAESVLTVRAERAGAPEKPRGRFHQAEISGALADFGHGGKPSYAISYSLKPFL